MAPASKIHKTSKPSDQSSTSRVGLHLICPQNLWITYNSALSFADDSYFPLTPFLAR